MNNNSTEILREYVRNTARKIKKEQKQKLKEELKLRRHIRKLINEVEEVSPHASTGINVLEDLLKTIIPIIEVGYKRLTTSEDQRESYRAHILRAIQNLLSTKSIYSNIDKKGAIAAAGLEEQEDEEVSSNESEVEQDPAFIDINKDKKKKEKSAQQPKPEDAFQAIPGEDPTGRGFALRTFQKVQNQVVDSFSLLGQEEDKELFYDYLLTNTKLYFDKFEDELQNKLEEPTTPEYEQEKQKKQQSLSGNATDTTGAGEAGGAGATGDVAVDQQGAGDVAAGTEETEED